MDNTSLLKFALLLSITGLFILCIVAYFTAPPLIEISEVENYVGRTIEIHGSVSSIRITPKTTFLSLTENKDSVDVVAFGVFSQKIDKFAKIRVIGNVERYKGEPEIIAEEVTLL